VSILVNVLCPRASWLALYEGAAQAIRLNVNWNLGKLESTSSPAAWRIIFDNDQCPFDRRRSVRIPLDPSAPDIRHAEQW
jgi:hypothetical protein